MGAALGMREVRLNNGDEGIVIPDAFEVIGGAPAIYEGATGRLLHHLGDPPPYVGSAPGQDLIFLENFD